MEQHSYRLGSFKMQSKKRKQYSHFICAVDLNYIGVIIGDDITYNTNTGKIEAVKSNYYDEKGKPVKVNR